MYRKARYPHLLRNPIGRQVPRDRSGGRPKEASPLLAMFAQSAKFATRLLRAETLQGVGPYGSNADLAAAQPVVWAVKTTNQAVSKVRREDIPRGEHKSVVGAIAEIRNFESSAGY